MRVWVLVPLARRYNLLQDATHNLLLHLVLEQAHFPLPEHLLANPRTMMAVACNVVWQRSKHNDPNTIFEVADSFFDHARCGDPYSCTVAAHLSKNNLHFQGIAVDSTVDIGGFAWSTTVSKLIQQHSASCTCMCDLPWVHSVSTCIRLKLLLHIAALLSS